MALEESSKATEEDTVTEVDGIYFIIAENQLIYFKNVKVDYVKSFFNLGEYKLINV